MTATVMVIALAVLYAVGFLAGWCLRGALFPAALRNLKRRHTDRPSMPPAVSVLPPPCPPPGGRMAQYWDPADLE
jgi:hypothetical protein